MKHWPTVAPLIAAALLGAAAVLPSSGVLAAVSGLALVGAVLAAVHHAEVVAHKVGEPLGTLVLALAVTVIETSLIVSMMLAGGPDKAVLARDTVYAAVMIICNGVIGLCILVGGLRHREQSFRIEGAGPAFAALVALATLVLILPGFTTSAPGLAYTPAQLAFAGLASLVLWGGLRLRPDRPPPRLLPPADADAEEGAPAAAATAAATWLSVGLLLVSLVGVVGLAKVLSPRIEARGSRRGRAGRGHRDRHRPAGAAPGDRGRGAGCPGRPAPDQHEPGAGLGPGDHRSDHPRGGHRLAAVPPAGGSRSGAEGPGAARR